MVILVNKRKVVWIAFLILIICLMVAGYKPYLKKFEYPLKYSEYVTSAAEKYKVDEYLIYSVIKAESKFKEDALSPKNAQGLMQITPETAKWAMEEMDYPENADIFSPQVNIEVGSWYLSKLISDFDGDLTAALAAYNAGSGNVINWLNEGEKLLKEDIEFEETYEYVEKTLKYYEKYKKLYEGGK